MSNTQDIVQRLWNLCHILRHDGVGYHEYVIELTLLLFLKMAKETETESKLPKGYRWDDLRKLEGTEQLDFYRRMLIDLGNAKSPLVRGVYGGTGTRLTKPTHLERLVKSIDALDWYSAREEGLGDLYEGLLEKNAAERKSGAGQYFTPRPLIDSMVALMKPKPGEVVQDPACGTGGFLIAADRYVKSQTDELFNLSDAEQKFQIQQAFVGVELVADTRRLGLMNCMLHNIEGPPGTEGCLRLGDTLSGDGARLEPADVILANPPFGTKGAGSATRDDFTYPTNNKQLAFLQHMYRGLKPGGRAAVVLPDNILFEEGVGRDIRRDLMNKCDLHTILRLPTGIFYAGGVKTNVLFFTRGKKDTGNTKEVWVYDLRANMPSFGKRTPFTREDHLAPFEKAFGKSPLGKSKRTDEGEEGRFRCFSLEDIEKRNWNLDIAWLRDEDADSAEDLGEPEDIANEIQVELRTALEELEELTALLESPTTTEEEAAE
ncbi:MAG: N-6 DNA methylase [Myxococcota bacterium]